MRTRPIKDVGDFEQRFVFRITRGLPLLWAGLATLVLAGAALGFVYSFAPVIKARAPEPSQPPPEVSILPAEVQALLAARTPPPASPPAPTSTRPAAFQGTPRTTDPAAVQIAQEIHRFRTWAEGRKLAWADRRERYCNYSYFGNCYDWRTRVAERGVGPFVIGVLDRYNSDSRQADVEVATPQGSEGYRVNPSNSAKKIEVLGELIVVAEASAQGRERPTVEAWAELRQQREADREYAIAAEETRIQQAIAEIEMTYAAKQAERLGLRLSAMKAIGAAIGALFMAGLILIIVAIERNTRTLQALLARQEAERSTRHTHEIAGLVPMAGD
jgi:hypothetical protein